MNSHHCLRFRDSLRASGRVQPQLGRITKACAILGDWHTQIHSRYLEPAVQRHLEYEVDGSIITLGHILKCNWVKPDRTFGEWSKEFRY